MSLWVRDIFLNGKILKKRLGKGLQHLLSYLWVVLAESWMLPAGHTVDRQMQVSPSKALPASRTAQQGNRQAPRRASLRPGSLCGCGMFRPGGLRVVGATKLFSISWIYTSFSQQDGIRHPSHRQTVRNPKPWLGVCWFRAQLCWKAGEDKGMPINRQWQQSF